MKIATLVTMQFAELDRVFQTFQDRLKIVLDSLCASPFGKVNVLTVTFPDSGHPTTHADGTIGYDLTVGHGLGVSNPRMLPTTLTQAQVSSSFTKADMTKALVNVSPDNAAKNKNPSQSIIVMSNQPSVIAQLVFF